MDEGYPRLDPSWGSFRPASGNGGSGPDCSKGSSRPAPDKGGSCHAVVLHNQCLCICVALSPQLQSIFLFVIMFGCYWLDDIQLVKVKTCASYVKRLPSGASGE